MGDVCTAVCFAYGGGFIATFALAADFIFGVRASGTRGFAFPTGYVWGGSLVCAALWPAVALAFAVSAVRKSFAGR